MALGLLPTPTSLNVREPPANRLAETPKSALLCRISLQWQHFYAKPAVTNVFKRATLRFHRAFSWNGRVAMWNRTDFEPVFFAPFVSSAMAVEREWIDYNGHLNMAYYNVLFDRALDEALTLLGLGPQYAAQRRASFFTAETHVRYLQELPSGSPVRVTVQLVDYDEKRLHLYQHLHHGSEGWVSATCEQVALHVDLGTRRVIPFPDDVLERVAGMKSVHAALPLPDGLGRSVGMSVRC